jgi:hypothetical protein
MSVHASETKRIQRGFTSKPLSQNPETEVLEDALRLLSMSMAHLLNSTVIIQVSDSF